MNSWNSHIESIWNECKTRVQSFIICYHWRTERVYSVQAVSLPRGVLCLLFYSTPVAGSLLFPWQPNFLLTLARTQATEFHQAWEHLAAINVETVGLGPRADSVGLHLIDGISPVWLFNFGMDDQTMSEGMKQYRNSGFPWYKIWGKKWNMWLKCTLSMLNGYLHALTIISHYEIKQGNLILKICHRSDFNYFPLYPRLKCANIAIQSREGHIPKPWPGMKSDNSPSKNWILMLVYANPVLT